MSIQQLVDLGLLNYVAVDIKTVPERSQYIRVTQSTGDILDRVKETVNLLKSSKISYEFRTTLVPTLIDSFDQLDQIRKWVGSRHYVLQRFRPADTVIDSSLTSTHSTEELQRFSQYTQKHGIRTRF